MTDNTYSAFRGEAYKLLIHHGIGVVYRAFEEASAYLGFAQPDTRYNFELALAPYRLDRSFHGQDHGSFMAIVTEDEIARLKAAGFNDDEVKFITSAAVAGGLYHDDVQLQADKGLEKNVSEILGSYATVTTQPPYQAQIHAEKNLSPAAKLVCEVFGFTPGQTIGQVPGKDVPGGANEFLSALVAAHCLVGTGPLDEQKRHAITAIAAIIEATIPFRNNQAFENLYDRLRKIGFDERQSEIMVKGAILVANRDVEGFCGGCVTSETSSLERFRRFVSGTWKLIPENNPKLRGQSYTPSDFRATLKGNLFFLTRILKPENIFHSFRGFPDTAEMEKRTAYATQNLQFLEQYMTAKIASASLVEAIAMTIDPQGKLPLPVLVNGLKPESFTFVDNSARFMPSEKIVYENLVNRGDSAPYAWDIPSSPTAAFLMQSIGTEGINRITQLAEGLLKPDQPNYGSFLKEVWREYGDSLNQILEVMKKIAHVGEQEAFEVGRGAMKRQAGIDQLKLAFS